MKNKNMTFEEMREALIKHPRVVDSLNPISQMVVKEFLKKDLGSKGKRED